MQRYFVNEINNDNFILTDSDIHHIKKVMRCKNNDRIEVVPSYTTRIDNLVPGIYTVTEYTEEDDVAINRFTCDTDEEIGVIKNYCDTLGVDAVPCEVWAKGGEGGLDLAQRVLELCKKPSNLTYAYELEDDIETKINAVVTKIYGGDGIELSDKAKKEIAKIKEMGMDKLPVIIAKTQYSLSDNPTLLGRPSGFTVKISDIKLRSGAGFIVAIAGNMLLMPGLSKTPAAMNMDIDNDGNITGLF